MICEDGINTNAAGKKRFSKHHLSSYWMCWLAVFGQRSDGSTILKKASSEAELQQEATSFYGDFIASGVRSLSDAMVTNIWMNP